MKTYLELEEMGIISSFYCVDRLMLITKGGLVWQYNAEIKLFEFSRNL